MERHIRPLQDLWRLWEFRARRESTRLNLRCLRTISARWRASRPTIAMLGLRRSPPLLARMKNWAGKPKRRLAAREGKLSSRLWLLPHGSLPHTNSPGKIAAYRKSQELLFKPARYLDIPVERVEIPFRTAPARATRLSPTCGSRCTTYRRRCSLCLAALILSRRQPRG